MVGGRGRDRLHSSTAGNVEFWFALGDGVDTVYLDGTLFDLRDGVDTVHLGNTAVSYTLVFMDAAVTATNLVCSHIFYYVQGEVYANAECDISYGDRGDTIHLSYTLPLDKRPDANIRFADGSTTNLRALVKDSNDDTVLGGNDTVPSGNDTVSGGDDTDPGGNDTVPGGNAGITWIGERRDKDRKRGTSGNDMLDGRKGNDKLFGNDGDDTLIGGAGRDTIVGGTGNDVLTGGKGADVFLFSSKLNGETNVDVITDFRHDVDTIHLKQSIFKKLTKGELNAAHFAKNKQGVATTREDYIIYNTKTGALLYDKDGNGGAAAVQFAVLKNKPKNVSASDFFVVK